MFAKIKNWYVAQSSTTKTMLWIGVVAIVLILLRWDYVMENIAKGFKFYSTKE